MALLSFQWDLNVNGILMVGPLGPGWDGARMGGSMITCPLVHFFYHVKWRPI